MASVSIKLDVKNKLKGTTKKSIVLVINHNRERFFISLKVAPVEPEHFILLDNGIGEISRKATYYNNIQWTNAFILSEKKRIEEALSKLQADNKLQNYSLKRLSVYLRGLTKTTTISFYDYYESLIIEKKQIKAYNTARTMRDCLVCLKKYSQQASFDDINYNFIKSFEVWGVKNNMSLNNIATKLRYLKSVYNRAIKDNLVSENEHPFKHYKIKTEKTQKRALSEKELLAIKNYNPSCDTEQLAKDIFLFSFYNAGINFKDMALLTKDNIAQGRIFYSRGKTKGKFTFKLSKESLSILAKYKNKGKYLFPIILQTDLQDNELLKHIQNRNSRITKYMKQIGEKLKLSLPLTSYVARHTFATIAKKKSIPISAISELLGHSDIKTTEIYLDTLPCSVLDNYLKKITANK